MINSDNILLQKILNRALFDQGNYNKRPWRYPRDKSLGSLIVSNKYFKLPWPW